MTDHHERKRLELAGNIAAEIGHEIGNPLAVIRGYLQLIQKKSPSDLQNYLTICLQELDQVTSLCQNFITLVRNNPAKPQLQDLNYLITNFIKLINAHLHKNNSTIQIEAEINLPLLNCCAQDIYTLLLDIIYPNLKYNNKLTIKTSLQNRNILMVIEQNNQLINSFSCLEILHNLRATLKNTKNSTTIFFPLELIE